MDKLVKSSYPGPPDPVLLLISPTWNKWNPSPKDKSPVGVQFELFILTEIELFESSESFSIFTIAVIS